MQQKSRFFYAPTSFGRSRRSEPTKEHKSKCPDGAETSPTNRFSIHEKKTLPVCHKLTCSIGCCCWSTRSCQWLGADALLLLSWSCDCWCYSFKIKAPRAPSIFWFPFFPMSHFLCTHPQEATLQLGFSWDFSEVSQMPPPPACHHSRLLVTVLTTANLYSDWQGDERQLRCFQSHF